MVIGILNISLYIPESNSLKAKRQVIHRLKANLRNNFNIAVTQIDVQDKWQRAELVFAGVEKSKDTMSSILSRVINFVENFSQVQVIDYQVQLM